MTRRAAPQLGVDRMVSISWSGEPAVKPPAHQGRASARGLEGRLTLQHPHASDQTGWKSRCRASFSLAIKHGIYRDTQQTPSLGHWLNAEAPLAFGAGCLLIEYLGYGVCNRHFGGPPQRRHPGQGAGKC